MNKITKSLLAAGAVAAVAIIASRAAVTNYWPGSTVFPSGTSYTQADYPPFLGKHSAADGSPGITTNITTGAVTFTIKDGLIVGVSQ